MFITGDAGQNWRSCSFELYQMDHRIVCSSPAVIFST